MDMAESVGRQVFQAIAHDGNGADPRTVDAGVLLAAEESVLAKSARSFGPTRDGTLVTDDIASGFKAGRERRIPLIVGSNDDETTAGAEPDFNEELNLAGDSVEALRRFYLKASSSPTELAASLYTDRVFTEPARIRGTPPCGHRRADVPVSFRLRSRTPARGRRWRSRTRDCSSSSAQKACPAPACSRIGTESFRIACGPTGPTSPGPAIPMDRVCRSGSKARRLTGLLLISNTGIASGDDPWSERLDWIERRSPKG